MTSSSMMRLLLYIPGAERQQTAALEALHKAFPQATVQGIQALQTLPNLLRETSWDALILPLPLQDEALRQALLEWRTQNPDAALIALVADEEKWAHILPVLPDGWLNPKENWPAQLPETLQHAVEQARQRAIGRLLFAAETPLGLFTADTQGRLQRFTPQLAAWLGQEPAALRGRPLALWLQTVHPPPLAQRLSQLGPVAKSMLLRLSGQETQHFQGWLWRPSSQSNIHGVIVPLAPGHLVQPGQQIQKALSEAAERPPEHQLRAALTALLQMARAQIAALYLGPERPTPSQPTLMLTSPNAPSQRSANLPCIPYALGWPHAPMRLNHAPLLGQQGHPPEQTLAHWLVFPLRLGAQHLGWLTLARTNTQPPFEEPLFMSLQEALGYLVALLERHQPLQPLPQMETQRQRDQTALNALRELSSLLRAQTFTDLWHTLSHCCHKLGWRFCALRLEGDDLVLEYHSFPAEVAQRVAERLGNPFTRPKIPLPQVPPARAALEARRPLLQSLTWPSLLSLVPNIKEELIPWLMATLGLPSDEDFLFFLPLYHSEQPWGLLVLWGAPHLHPEDASLIEMIYPQIQTTLEKLLSLEKSHRCQDQHRALAALSARLFSCSEIFCVAQALIATLTEAFAFPRVAVYQYAAPNTFHLAAQQTSTWQGRSYPPSLTMPEGASWMDKLSQAIQASALEGLSELQPEDIVAPLQVKDHLYGLLVLHTPSADHQTLAWINKVAAIASQAWHQSHLVQRTTQHLERHRVLRSSLLALTQHLDTEKTAQELLQHAMNLAHPQSVALWMADEDETRWRLAGQRGDFVHPPQPPQEPPRLMNPAPTSAPSREAAYIPLFIRGKVVGAFEVRWKTAPSPEILDLLTLLAAQGAVALTNAQLFTQAQTNAQTLEVLFQSSREIALASLEPEAVYQRVHQALQALMEHDAFVLALYHPEKQLLDIPYIVEDGTRIPAQQTTLEEATLLGFVVKQRRPLFIRDFEKERAVLGLPYYQVGHMMRSILAVPLLRQERVIGVLSLQAKRSHAYHKQHLQLLETLAAQAAVALENAVLYEKTRQLALTDPLTGLYNRRYLFALGTREIQRARRFNHPLTAAMIDLDAFKQVNDTYGHHIGDEVLRQWAQRASACLREVDVLGRYGGDEFGIFLPETPLEQALHLARRLRHRISATPFRTEVGPIHLTASIGLAVWDESITSPAALLQEADFAQYAAKHTGKNRIAWLDPKTHDLRIEP